MSESLKKTADAEPKINRVSTHFNVTAEEIRAGFEDYIRVNFYETGFLSRAEVESQRGFVNRVLRNPDPASKDYQGLVDSYVGSYAEKSKETNLRTYFYDLIGPLKNAMESGAIPASSYKEWLEWIHDPNREAREKKDSIARVLPEYLSKRRELANKRSAILEDSRFKSLESSSDSRLKSLYAKISDTTFFLEELTFEQRKSVITDVLNILPTLKDEEELFETFMEELDHAVGNKWISAASRKKWIARFKNPSVNRQSKEYFVRWQFPSYVKAWAAVHGERDTLLKKGSVAHELTTKECPGIKTFLSDEKFLELHYDDKVALVTEVKAAMKSVKEGKNLLMKETRTVLEAAASAGYMSKNKVGPWLLRVIAGERTLAELKEFIKDWAKVRYRFDEVEYAMTRGKVPQGLQRISAETFLNMSYRQRLSYVEGAEERLHMEKTPPKDTPLQDIKGKIRHALDQEDWEEAEYFLEKAWPLAVTEKDIHELQSMQKYMNAFRGKKEMKNAPSANEEIQNAYKEIFMVLHLLPVSLRPVYEKALRKGPDCLQCVTKCVYNRTWCEERGYLTEGLEERLRQQSIEETAERLRASGEGHSDGRENNFVDGFHQPSIRDSGIGPQNLFMSANGADSFVEKADANKYTWSFWYWTNLMVDGVSSGQNSYVAHSLNFRIKRAARTLEKHGLRFDPLGHTPSVN